MPENIPADLSDLVERPLYGTLGTIRPDNTVQVNPMWFEYDGEHLRFTHTSKREKYRNLQHHKSMSFVVFDPDKPIRYIELRGSLAEIVPDPEGAFYVQLAKRYGSSNPQPPADRADRVILVMSVDRVSRH
ncbi:MAG: PPOX class F420-dependent oxidoreductase [Acidimicrobiaceae bacterium]|nr:PPOX class F420-dependent oxidoreductase [Acidimicrobiaceae bacterium]MBO0747662.1 PPOX class F420-dependent oxidoreductase [Acidimicrobiaceae bacterium]